MCHARHGLWPRCCLGFFAGLSATSVALGMHPGRGGKKENGGGVIISNSPDTHTSRGLTHWCDELGKASVRAKKKRLPVSGLGASRLVVANRRRLAVN